MATREAVYEHFGRAAQSHSISKVILVRLVLAIDALDTQSFLTPTLTHI